MTLQNPDRRQRDATLLAPSFRRKSESSTLCGKRRSEFPRQRE